MRRLANLVKFGDFIYEIISILPFIIKCLLFCVIEKQYKNQPYYKDLLNVMMYVML